MAWNRPSEDGRANTPSSTRCGRSPRPTVAVRGAIAGAVVVLGAAVAAWWLWSAGESAGETPPHRKETLIKEVKPQLSAKEQEKLAHPGMVKVRGKWYPEYDKDGGKIWITGYGIRYHTPTVRTNHFNKALISPERKIFDNRADQDIAILLNTDPGTTFIGGFKFSKNFEKEFLKSIECPIIVSHDDPPDVANLKRAVTETKIELKARYDNGENIAEILNDSLTELKKLSAYRDDLLRLTREQIRQNKPSAEETKTIYEAANKMLADRGIRPLRMPVFLKNNLKLKVKKEK